ncbi:MAG TPA: hypothetical protein PK211_04490 [Agitococcus sp.]|nr:hypothetical protein [Agitococcus sp.]
MRLYQMNVNVTIPTSLFVKLYKKYGEDLEQEIITALSKLVSLDSSSFLEEEPEDDFYENRQNRGRGNLTGGWPSQHTTGYNVWRICESILAEDNQVLRADHRERVLERCQYEDIKLNTASTMYSGWRKYKFP